MNNRSCFSVGLVVLWWIWPGFAASSSGSAVDGVKVCCAALEAATEAVTAGETSGGQRAYLFTSFRGNGEDGLHLAYSYDGYRWTDLNKVFVRPEVGKSKLMRDPCVIQGPDGMFHMVWTTGWWEKGIGYAHSRDLLKWSEQKCIEVMAHEGKAKNCWAPEVFYDEANGQYLIFWASTIPGRFPETEKKGDNNHRIYYVATKDFESFSRAKLLYEHGFNVIDATIVRDGRQYLMFLKDETVHPPQKNIRLATAKAAEGPYSEPSQAITGQYWAEGPTAIKIGDTWFVYFDKYRERSYGVVVSKDLKNWADVSDKLQFPKGSRHGTILQVSNRVLDKLMGKEQAALPNVLIIGDSISIGYFPSVKELLEDKAVVVHNPGNAQHTRFGLDKLDQWLGQSKWDVIHFNHGLHDLKYVDEKGKNVPVEKGRQQVPIDEYEKNLEELVKRLKSTGAALIFASTTPVPDGTGIRVQGDAKKYNVVAERVMKKHGVAVNDLYSFAMLRLGEIQRPKNVHFNDAGSRLLAEQVAVAILSKLE